MYEGFEETVLVHEVLHCMSLSHSFCNVREHSFKALKTDNIMDYVNQAGTSNRNPFEANDKINNFYKWQWEIMRKDRSLILTY